MIFKVDSVDSLQYEQVAEMNKFLQMIKQAVTTLTVNFSGPYPRGQAKYNGKTSEYVLLIPYGMISSPPEGSHTLLFSSQGQEAVKFGIASDFTNKDGAPNQGEAGLRNALTGGQILFKANGDAELRASVGGSSVTLKASDDIEVDAKKDLVGTIAGETNLTGGGDVNLNITGDVTITASVDINLTSTGKVNLGGPGGAGVARIGDAVVGGVITGGSTKVLAVA